MSKITLSHVADLTQSTTAENTINADLDTIVTAFDNTISRDGSNPNQMQANLDMNSNQIINLPAPSTVNSPARLVDVTTNPTIVIPPTGTSGHVVPYLDGNNTWSGTEVFNGNVTFNGTVTGIGTVIPGWLNNTSSKTANYTVVAGDSGNTLALGGSSFYTLTFNAPAGYNSNFICMITNTDSYPGGRGKKVSINGYSPFILWPGQNVLVFNRNGTWDYHPKAQRWIVPAQVTFYVDTAGNDGNDGLVSGSGAFATLQAAASAAYYQIDCNGVSPIISPTAGQTFVQQLNLGGQLTGNNVLWIQGNGGSFNWQTPGGGGSMLSIGDNAECIIQNVNFISSNNIFGRAAIYLHNNGLVDVFGGVTFQGGGLNDTAIFMDNASTICTIANNVTVSNTFGSIVWMDNGGKCTVGGIIAPSGATVVQTGIFRTRYRSALIIGAAVQNTGWTSVNPSVSEKGGLLDTNGTTVPGGTSAVTQGIVL